jgi:glycosyltransferase involved in cell wall biosynthesis
MTDNMLVDESKITQVPSLSKECSWPKITVVTPSYNQAQFLERTILSVINQNYPNLEFMIIDGGSTDGSAEIIKKYENYLAYWVTEKDAGQTDAINKGWRRASGQIIAYLNSDDTYTPNAMKKVAAYFEQHPNVDAVYGVCNLIDENDKVINIWEPAEFSLKALLRCGISTIPQQTVFFRRKILDEIGFLDISLRHAMDYEYWIRIGQKFNFQKIPYTLANFRIQSKSKTSLESHTQWQESCRIRAKYLDESKLRWAFGYYTYKLRRIWPKFIRPFLSAKSNKERLNVIRPVSELIKSSFWATKQRLKNED